MALLSKADGLITTAQTIASGQGTFILHFEDDYDISVNFDKLAKESVFTIPAASGTFEGISFPGNSYAITGTALAGTKVLLTQGFGALTNNAYTIAGGFGKVEIGKASVTNDDGRIVNISDVVGAILDDGDIDLIDGKGVLFLRQTGIAYGVVENSDTAITDDTIAGGFGIAEMIVNNANQVDTFSVPDGTAASADLTFTLSEDPKGSVAFSAIANTTITHVGRVVTVEYTGAVTAATFTATYDGPDNDQSIKIRLNQVDVPFTVDAADGVSIKPLGGALVFTS